MPDKKKNWSLAEIDELLIEARKWRKEMQEQEVIMVPIRYPPGSNFPVGPGMQQC